MSRKIHLTESQVEEIVNKLNEDSAPITIDATADVTAANGNASIGMKKAKDRAKMSLGNKDATLTCDSDVVMECYTKKQIKEAKLRYLKEHSTAYSKKDFKNRFIGK